MSSNFNSFHSFSPVRIRAPLTLDEDSFSSSSEIGFSYGKPGRIRAGNTMAIPSDCDTVTESELSEAESDSRFFCRDDGRIAVSLTSPFLEFPKMGETKEDSPQFRPIAQLSMDDDAFESLVSEEDVHHEFDYRMLSIASPGVDVLESDEDGGADHESLGHDDCDSLSDKEIDCVEFVRDSISSPLEYVKHVVAENETLFADEKQERQDEIQQDSIESMAVSDIDEQREELMVHLKTIKDEQLEEHIVDSIDVNHEQSIEIEIIPDFDVDELFVHSIDANPEEPIKEERLEELIVVSIDANREESTESTPDFSIDEPMAHLKTVVDANPKEPIKDEQLEELIVVSIDANQEETTESIPDFGLDEPMAHLKTIVYSIDANLEEPIKDEQLEELTVDSIDENQEESIEMIPDFGIDEPMEHLEAIVDSKQLEDDEETSVYYDWGDSESCIVMGETRVRQGGQEEEILSVWEPNMRSVKGVFRFVNGMKITLSDTSGFGSVDTETRLIMLYVVDILDSVARAWDDLSLTKLLSQFFSLPEVQRIQREIMPVLEDTRGTLEYPNVEYRRTEKMMSCYLLNDGYDDETVNGCTEKGCVDTRGEGVQVGKKGGVTWQALVGVGLGSGTVVRVGMNGTCRGVIGVKTTNSWLHLSIVTLAPLLSSVCKNVFSL